MILRGFSREQNLFLVERGPECVGHLAGCRDRRVKVCPPDIETNWTRHYRIIKAGHHAECRRDLGEKSAAIAAIMEVGQGRIRCYPYLFRVRYDLRCGWRFRCPFPQCVSQTLLGKLILRIKMQRAAELGQGFDLL